jgi:hypothetical protein
VTGAVDVGNIYSKTAPSDLGREELADVDQRIRYEPIVTKRSVQPRRPLFAAVVHRRFGAVPELDRQPSDYVVTKLR